MSRKCVKAAIMSLAAAVLFCIPVFAGTAEVTVTRKTLEESEIGSGYMILKLDEAGVNKMFDYPDGKLVPGESAEGQLKFALSYDIAPVNVKLDIANMAADSEVFNALKLRIVRGGNTLYDGLLKEAAGVDLGTFFNDSKGTAYEALDFTLTFDKGKDVNALQGKKFSFSMELTADMADYIAVKKKADGSVEIYQSLYNDLYYYPASGVPALESQHNSKGTAREYYPDYPVTPGTDGLLAADTFYTDYADGLNVYAGPDGTFGTADDRKDLTNGSNIERGTNGFGGGKAADYQNDIRYFSGEDKIPGTQDDQRIYKDRNGKYGTELEYYINPKNSRINRRPGPNKIYGDFDDESWQYGADKKHGTLDDTFVGRHNDPNGPQQTSNYEGAVVGEGGVASSPVAFAKAVEGDWVKNGNIWTFFHKGEQIRGKWAYIYSKTLDQSDWYFFDAAGNMQTGWQKTGTGKWYRLHSAKDAREGAMEKGLYFEPEDGKYYYLDSVTGVMQTGWVKINDKYYYFSETASGNSWFWNSALGRWAYNALNGRPVGSMYVDEVTPDGWRVDKTGARTEKVSQ